MLASIKGVFFAAAVLLSLHAGCSSPEEDGDIAARVGEREIGIEEVLQFQEDSDAAIHTDKGGLEALRYFLQAMVDMELMLIEARAGKLDQNPKFARRWEKERKKKLVDEYTARKIVRKIDFGVEEAAQRFAESKWNRVLKLAHIRVDSEIDAQKVLRDLEQGKPFEVVARQRSTQAETASRDGLLEPWYGRHNLEEYGLTLEVGEALFALQAGAFSQPFRLGEHFEIFKVLAEAPAPDHFRSTYIRGQFWEELYARWNEMVAELKARMDVRPDQETVDYLVNKMAGAGKRGILLSPEEQEMVICRFKGGHLTLLDFAETYNSLWVFMPIRFDNAGIHEFIDGQLLPKALVAEAALQEGLDRDSTVVTWLAHKKEALLLEELRQQKVVQRVSVDSVMVRDFYDANLELFMQFEQVEVLEVLVATREQADELAQKIRDGEDIGALAARHSIRPDGENGRLHLHNHPSERRVFGYLYDEVMQAEVGELTGPVELDEGYSVFRVLERISKRPVPFEQAASRAAWWVKKQEERRYFDALFPELREKYASQVEFFEDRLKKAVEN